MKVVRSFVLALVGVCLLIVITVIGIGWFIAPHEKLSRADAIVVVSGGDTDKRTDEGIKLFREGWAPTLILVGAAADQGTSNASVMRIRAVKAGVPVENTLIEEKSTNTQQNAAFLKPITDSRNIRSAILVSSPYHTRRVKTTFQKVFGPDYHFIAHAAKDSRWARSSWWQNRDTTDLTFAELEKTLYVKFVQK